ncbi:hypothetical protein BVRB_1g000800 [Beta vulgaris subsp. vulgaris]|nr:hypothetical protein BVRB_1g000800 [Beta vulgaris subsp. vulgaris]
MADQIELQIPVFTVWKNNVILKNIFLINTPPSSATQLQTQQQNHEISKTHQQFEETLVIGRHPDCDIRLEHPSISRFHLRIHSKPSSNYLSLTDLSSVHGTWVSGKRIEPNIRTRINENDTLRIGGSSRVYKLQWIPLSKAYDVSNPFVPPLDFVQLKQDEEEEIMKDENSLGLEEEKVVVVQAVDSVSNGLESGVLFDEGKLVIEQVAIEIEEKVMADENDFVEFEDPHLEGLITLFEDKNSQVFAGEEMPPDPPTQKVEFECTVEENVQPLDSVLEGLVPLFLGENWEWVGQGENDYIACPIEEVYPQTMKHEDMSSVDSILEGLDTLFLEKNSEDLVQKVNSSPSSMPENKAFHTTPNVENTKAGETGSESVSETTRSENELPLPEEDIQKANASPPSTPEDMAFHTTPNFENTTSGETGCESVSEMTQRENKVPLLEEDIQKANSSRPLMPEDMASHMTPNVENTTAGETGSGSVSEMIQSENKIPLPEEDIPKVNASPHLMPEDMAFHTTPNVENTTARETGSEPVSEMTRSENKIPLPEEDIQDSEWNFWCASPIALTDLANKGGFLSNENNHLDRECQYPENESELSIFSERKCLESIDAYQNSSAKDHNESKLWSFWSGKMGVESPVCSSFSDAGFFSESGNKSLRNSCESPPLSSVKRSFGSPLITSDEQSSIWSRRGKLPSAPQILTSRSERKKLRSDQKILENEPVSRALFHEVESQEEEEIFTPDKENFTPNTRKSMRNLAMLKEVKNSSSGKSPLSKMIGSSKIYYEDSMSPSSDKENHSLRASLGKKTSRHVSENQVKSVRLKEKKGKRMPFQSLLADSPQNSTSEACIHEALTVTCKDKCSGEKTRKWSMLVDSTTLLNKESRKALQLLEGLKGTQLIIPKIVIKDLACLKRQTSFFRRNTEVSSALEWIEDCMVKTQWWIHVQNSTEEGRPAAPTPPASPYSGSFAISSLEFFSPEILSPTIEDHVLDYALSFRRNKNDGQLVLLSNDITLKIKAMAEGIICETAEDFRESLVNPFSERFLWTDSSPRGQTWSYSDDFVLKEKFYPSSLKMTPKGVENVKGLKLILLHNSQYFDRKTANSLA